MHSELSSFPTNNKREGFQSLYSLNWILVKTAFVNFKKEVKWQHSCNSCRFLELYLRLDKLTARYIDGSQEKKDTMAAAVCTTPQHLQSFTIEESLILRKYLTPKRIFFIKAIFIKNVHAYNICNLHA